MSEVDRIAALGHSRAQSYWKVAESGKVGALSFG